MTITELAKAPPRLLIPVLQRLDIQTADQLLALDIAEVAKYPGVGPKKLQQLQQYIDDVRALVSPKTAAKSVNAQPRALPALPSTAYPEPATIPWTEALGDISPRIHRALGMLSAHTLQDVIELVCSQPRIVLELPSVGRSSLRALRDHLESVVPEHMAAAKARYASAGSKAMPLDLAAMVLAPRRGQSSRRPPMRLEHQPLADVPALLLAELVPTVQYMVELHSMDGLEPGLIGKRVGEGRARVCQLLDYAYVHLARAHREPLQRVAAAVLAPLRAAGGVLLDSELRDRLGIGIREARLITRLAGVSPLCLHEHRYVCIAGFPEVLEEVRAELQSRPFVGVTASELARLFAARKFPISALRAREVLSVRSDFFQRWDDLIEIKTSLAQVAGELLRADGGMLHWSDIAQRIEATYQPGELLRPGTSDDDLRAKRRRVLQALDSSNAVQRVFDDYYVYADANRPHP